MRRCAILTTVLVLGSLACSPDRQPPVEDLSALAGDTLPPALGDPITDSRMTVVYPAKPEWVVGDTFSLSDLQGKPIILDFFATWCGPCLVQHEYVMALKEEYGDQVNIIGVLWEDKPENVGPWLAEHGSSYPTVMEVDGGVAKQFWINSLPYFVLLTPDRRLSWDMAFPWAKDSVADRLQAMLHD